MSICTNNIEYFFWDASFSHVPWSDCMANIKTKILNRKCSFILNVSHLNDGNMTLVSVSHVFFFLLLLLQLWHHQPCLLLGNLKGKISSSNGAVFFGMPLLKRPSNDDYSNYLTVSMSASRETLKRETIWVKSALRELGIGTCAC